MTSRRRFALALVQRSQAVERALCDLLRIQGRMTTMHELREALKAGTVAPLAVSVDAERLARALEPGVAEGRVQRVFQRGRAYFGHRAVPAAEPAASDGAFLIRLRELLRELVIMRQSAIPMETLMLASVQRGVARGTSRENSTHAIARSELLKHGDIVLVRLWAKDARSAYLTVADGPRRVVWTELRDVDRRRTIVYRYWAATEGRPFTTAALRRYANRLADCPLPDDRPYEWTTALAYLYENEELVRLPNANRRREALWAVRASWYAMTAEEQAERLRDDRRDVDGVSSDDGGEKPMARPPKLGSGEDTTFRSRNADLQVLVREARRRRVARATPEDREIVARQPVPVADLRAALVVRRHLLRGRTELVSAVFEACRLRPGMRTAALVRVGPVGKRSHYDEAHSADVEAYGHWLDLSWDPSARKLLWWIDELRADAAVAAGGRLPIPPIILAMRTRAAELHRDQLLQRLDESLRHAPLTSVERAETRKKRRAIDRAGMLLLPLSRKLSVPSCPDIPHSLHNPLGLPRTQLLSLPELPRIVSGAGVPADRVSQTIAVMRRLVMRCERPELLTDTKPPDAKGRLPTYFFDRVGVALHLARASRLPRDGLRATIARSVLGTLRDVRALEEGDSTSPATGRRSAMAWQGFLRPE